MTDELLSRVRQLEDRNAISECVIHYAMAIDRADWDLFASCLTDPIYIDFSENGMPARNFPRDEFINFSKQGLSGFTARHHLSPNHVITFDGTDPERAVCESYLYAQHYLQEGDGGDLYLLRGRYLNSMLRTENGWRIERLTQHISWVEGSAKAPAEAAARFKLAQAKK